MEYRKFGTTGLTVSTVGFGAWAIGGPATAGGIAIGWGETDDAVSFRALERARGCGVTFFDTSDFYGLGHSEELIGKAFGNAPDLVIATKVGQRLDSDGGIVSDYSISHLTRACEESLRRLRRETIDLYQLHTARLRHLEEGACVEAMERLREAGKIRAWGLSLNTFTPAPEAEYMISRRIGNGFQLALNIINQRALPVIRQAAEAGYGIIVRMPFQFGLLTGAMTEKTTFSAGDHRSYRLTPEVLKAAMGPVQEIGAIAARLGMATATLALSYCVSYPGVSTVIPGIRTPAQAEADTAVNPMSGATQARLEEMYSARLRQLLEQMEKNG